MKIEAIQPDESLALFVKSILVFEESDESQKAILPFFADGFPGLLFQQTQHGLVVSPHNKEMPVLFLYGQTIKPVQLHIQGAYKLVVFQLYPFMLKSFFNITAKDITDGCYDLAHVENGPAITQQLLQNPDTKERITCLSDFLIALFEQKKEQLDLSILAAIQLIFDTNGQMPVSELAEKTNLTERTFERRFLSEIGILPKQFSQVVQFQRSFEQLTSKDFTSLTDIVYANGFADQSHFIRVFKAFTGQTPGKFIAGTA